MHKYFILLLLPCLVFGASEGVREDLYIKHTTVTMEEEFCISSAKNPIIVAVPEKSNLKGQTCEIIGGIGLFVILYAMCDYLLYHLAEAVVAKEFEFS